MRPADPPLAQPAAPTAATHAPDPAADTSAAEAKLKAYNEAVIRRVKAVKAMFNEEGLEKIDPTQGKSFNVIVRDTLTTAALHYALLGVFKAPEVLRDGEDITPASTDDRLRKAGFVVSGQPGTNAPEIARHPAGRLAMAEGFDPDHDQDDVRP